MKEGDTASAGAVDGDRGLKTRRPKKGEATPRIVKAGTA